MFKILSTNVIKTTLDFLLIGFNSVLITLDIKNIINEGLNDILILVTIIFTVIKIYKMIKEKKNKKNE